MTPRLRLGEADPARDMPGCAGEREPVLIVHEAVSELECPKIQVSCNGATEYEETLLEGISGAWSRKRKLNP